MLADTPRPEGVRLSDGEPTGTHLLVQIPSVDEKTKGGIYVPQSATKDKGDIWTNSQPPTVGVVFRVGPDCAGDYGQRGAVIFLPNAGVTFTAEGVRYILIEEACVLAQVEYRDPDFEVKE